MTVRVHPGNQSKIEQAFWGFHEREPGVYDELVKLARDLRQRGYTRLGIGMLFEILRWRRMSATRGDRYDFVLNNNYRAYYARLIMERERDLDGIFNTRELSVEHHVVSEPQPPAGQMHL